MTITDKSDHINDSCTLTYISVCAISDIHVHTTRQMYACFTKNVDIQYSTHEAYLSLLLSLHNFEFSVRHMG